MMRGIGFDYREIVDASAHDGGSDFAKLQILQSSFVRGFRETPLMHRRNAARMPASILELPQTDIAEY